MLRAPKNKRAEARTSSPTPDAPKVGITDKKRTASPDLNLERRKRGAHTGASFEAELSEDFPPQTRVKGKEPVFELGDSPATSPTPLRSHRPYNFGDSLMQPGSESAACYLLFNLLPEADLPLVQQATDQEVNERMALGLLQVRVHAFVLPFFPW